MQYSYRKHLLVLAGIAAILQIPSRALAGVGCPGDCDANGTVSIAELVTSIDIALKLTPLSACPRADRNGDGKVTVNELLKAITATFNNCQFCDDSAQCDLADTMTEGCGDCGTPILRM